MRVSGERASSGEGGFNPSFQRHRANYALALPFLPLGRTLDLACGAGHSLDLLGERETVGVDRHPGALAGQPRETVVADMRALPFADATFPAVICSHAIEHVKDPERVLAEAARVLAPGGVAVFTTPNRLTFARPDEIIDPYHYVEWDPAQFAELCAGVFDSVEVHGIFGSERYRAYVAGELEQLDRLLAKDPLRLRRFVPRRVRQVLYDRRLRGARRDAPPEAAAITVGDFELRREDVEAAADLMAVCRRQDR